MRAPQLLIFRLNNEEFGISISDVNGILDYKAPTGIPGTSDYIEGIISLKGDVVVAVNLKSRFDMENTVIADGSRIIVVNSEEFQLGFIVDEVIETISSDILGSANYNASYGVNPNYIAGFRRYMGITVALLDTAGIIRDIEV